ncbi:PA2169 family four-helix-bundle protein [Winogradskyella psychrotolerans]|uniref:ferritin-like domain-containing protein n=1 Tax=Winogradskyella psychrotolerans TaxID=1344585 RepID=UPI001C069A6F|nr:PA2169 family four-helix-bundle protein [Winogradskyella psychrotolerans]MBU2919893.1 PA2169 family four-helix-bundle protein [Winogradskyella psychrotolerans]
MSTYTEEVGEKLNNLLEKTYDAEKGFTKAAENIEHASLKSYFRNKAQERLNFGRELKQEIRSFNQDVDKGGSLTGKAHRAWMDVKSLFSADDEQSMLNEAIRGEKAAIEEYEDVINETSLPMSTKSVLQSQKSTITNGLAKINVLEDLH